jgi:hypothetical protein
LILGLWVSGKIGVMKIHFQDEKVTWPKHRGKGT